MRTSIGRLPLRAACLGAGLLVLAAVLVPCNPAIAQEANSASAAAAPKEATVESLFVDFLHFARLGRFTAADGYARALLAHPDLKPVELLEFASRDRKSVDTLLILVKESSIGDNAARVLDLIQDGEFERRRNPDRIKANIELLTGNPQQEYMAIQHLADSGEYAIPFMLEVLIESPDGAVRPRVVTALPRIGKPAVNPLVMALRMPRGSVFEDARLHVIHALGEIGYTQAIPYLRKLMMDADMPPAAKEAAEAAITRIESITGRTFEGSAADLFYRLADRYYNEEAAVRADPRLNDANVWYWNNDAQTVTATEVPQRVWGQVMAMRCCEEALEAQPDKANAIALWLASNIRREGRLGMDVESGDPAEIGEVDATRPAVFPRALYYTQAAGPRYAHLVLERAVADNDAIVALGAIEALRITAGESSLIGTEDYKQPLVHAMRLPDRIVRIRAALALGSALPKSQFAGSQLAVPVLADALKQTGRKQVLVIDSDEDNLNRVMGAMRGHAADVIGETNFFTGMNRARVEFQSVAAIFLSTDLTEPDLRTAVAELRSEFLFAKTPVIVLVKPEQSRLAEELARGDLYLDRVDAAVDAGVLEDRLEHLAQRTGQKALDPDLALALALQSAETLRRIALDGRTVLNFGAAEPALIGALSSISEDLQIAAASVLALAVTETAQRAIAHVALDPGNTKTLRVASFGSLAESAKNNNNLLEPGQMATLVEQARAEADLDLRTAASRALGAINLADNQASDIIRSYYGG